MDFNEDGTILGDTTFFNDVTSGFGDVGPDRLAYAGGNAALVGTNGLPVEPFDIPVTVTP